MGLVSLGNGRHIGMLAYHAMMALEHDMIGTCMASCSPRMVPTFSSKRAIGTNPISYAAPADKLPPFVFDAAMTSVAGNKIVLASRLGVPLEPGWIADKRGNPIMEEVYLNDFPEFEAIEEQVEAESFDISAAVGAGLDLPFGLRVDARYNFGFTETIENTYGSGAPCGGSMMSYENKIYRSQNWIPSGEEGIVPLDDELNFITTGRIGNYQSPSIIYHMENINGQIYITITDYGSTNFVKVLDNYGNEIASYTAGIMPGDLAYWKKSE